MMRDPSRHLVCANLFGPLAKGRAKFGLRTTWPNFSQGHKVEFVQTLVEVNSAELDQIWLRPFWWNFGLCGLSQIWL